MLMGRAVSGDVQLDKIQTHLGDGPLGVLQGLSWFGLIWCGKISSWGWDHSLSRDIWRGKMEKLSELRRQMLIHPFLFPVDAMWLTTSSHAAVTSLAMANCNLELWADLNRSLLSGFHRSIFYHSKGKETMIRRERGCLGLRPGSAFGSGRGTGSGFSN